MARILPTYEAQRRVDVREWRALSPWQGQLWTMILVACMTPGIPIDDELMQVQLQAIWGATSVTFQRLIA